MSDTRPVVVALGAVAPDLVEHVLGGDVRFVAEPTDDDLREAVGAIVRADAIVDLDALDAMPSMRVLARTGVGVDRVDVEEATRRGIAVVITPGSGTNAVAEGAIGMAVALAKRFLPLTDLVREGRWGERGEVPVGDLEGATIGIVGFGRIGRRLGELAAVFGMAVRAYDPFADIPADLRCDSVDDIARVSDVISLHVPLVPETESLVDDALLTKARAGALLVNCGRGGLVDLDAVDRALADGRLGGLAVDVFDPEPPVHHPVFERDNVILTPHVMGLSARATRSTFRDAARGVVDVLGDRPPAAVANPAWLDVHARGSEGER